MSGEIKESHLGVDGIQRVALFSISLYYQAERESFQTRKHRYVKLDSNRNCWLWLYFLKSKRVISKWGVERVAAMEESSECQLWPRISV